MSSIENAKVVMSFVPAKKRPSCSLCEHAEERDCIYPTWWCTKGGFLTSALAICAYCQPRDGALKP